MALLVVAVLAVMAVAVARDGDGGAQAVGATEREAPAGAPEPTTAPTEPPGDAIEGDLPEAPADTIPPSGATYPCAEAAPRSWQPASTDANLIVETVQGSIPSASSQPGPMGEPTIASTYETIDDFLAQSNVSDPALRHRAMEEAGYSGGVEYEYAGFVPATVQILAFRDAEAAKGYVEVRLPDLCRLQGTDALVPLGDDGFAFVDGMGAVHGDFLLGGSQVSLVLCECIDDPIESMKAWYVEWITQYGS